MKTSFNQTIADLVSRGATFFISHSGGKDSQAMFLYLKARVPAEQIVVVHAHLEGVEWEGVVEHIEATIAPHKLHIVAAGKTFMGMVRGRGMWPSAQHRQCTSDLKTAPINKFLRQWSKASGKTLLVNCTGIRAGESATRAKKNPFKLNENLSKAGREVYDFMPIFTWSTADVFGMIKAEGQEPHWAYGKGMTRLSCCFCIMASKHDLRISAELNPEKLEEIAQIEKEIGHTIFMERKQPIDIKTYIASDLSSKKQTCEA